jgi:phosphatidate cytidylyltransferase
MAEQGALRRRLTVAPVLIAALILIFWGDARAGTSAPGLLALALLLTVRSTWEYVDLVRHRGLAPRFPLLAGCAAAVVAANWLAVPFPSLASADVPLARFGPPMLVLGLMVMLLFGNALKRYESPGGNLERLGIEVLGLAYLGVLISATVQLRWVAGPGLVYLPLASVVVVTKCGDTAAYFAGHAFGGKKLSPLISPGKTWAGAVGALFGAALGGWLALSLVPGWIGAGAAAAWYWSVLYGVVIGILGIIGDLAESLIKRDVGRKDSAPLLPGFGGLLDLLDSVIYVGPAAYFLWIVLPLPR